MHSTAVAELLSICMCSAWDITYYVKHCNSSEYISLNNIITITVVATALQRCIYSVISRDPHWFNVVKWYEINNHNSRKYPKTSMSYQMMLNPNPSRRKNYLTNRRSDSEKPSFGSVAGAQSKNHEKQIYSRNGNGVNLMQRERNTHRSRQKSKNCVCSAQREMQKQLNFYYSVYIFPLCFSHLLFLLGYNCTNSSERRQWQKAGKTNESNWRKNEQNNQQTKMMREINWLSRASIKEMQIQGLQCKYPCVECLQSSAAIIEEGVEECMTVFVSIFCARNNRNWTREIWKSKCDAYLTETMQTAYLERTYDVRASEDENMIFGYALHGLHDLLRQGDGNGPLWW